MWFGNTHRLFDGSPESVSGLADGFPLAEDAGEPARVHQAVRGQVGDLDHVLAQIAGIEELGLAAGPVALDAHAIEREVLLVRGAGVQVVHAERLAGEVGREIG